MAPDVVDLVEFLERLFAELDSAGVDVDRLLMDHVCFRTESAEDYARTKAGFAACSRLLAETDVNGRPIATFRLHEPVIHQGRVVRLVEVPAPKPGKRVMRGFEHAEFVLGEAFTDFASCHPGLAFAWPAHPAAFNAELGLKRPSVNVKFHHLPLDGVIALEQQEGLIETAVSLGVFAELAEFQPRFSGSLPLALAGDRAAVAVLCECADLDAFDQAMAARLDRRFPWTRSRTSLRGRETSLIRFEAQGRPWAWMAQTVPVHRQAAARHQLIEARLLNLGGEPARLAIRALMAEGHAIEAAFARYFALAGDPDEALLELAGESEAALLERFGSLIG